MGNIYNHISVRNEKPFTTLIPEEKAIEYFEFSVQTANARLSLNTLLTVRWDALFAEQADYAFLGIATRDRIARSVELLRKFFTNRDIKFAYIWVQENPKREHGGLHWHIGFHCPVRLHEQLLKYAEHHLGLHKQPRWYTEKPLKGELGLSEARAWHLGADIFPQRRGRGLTAYLLKGCPKIEEISRQYGVFQEYAPQGEIEGKFKDRFGKARTKF